MCSNDSGQQALPEIKSTFKVSSSYMNKLDSWHSSNNVYNNENPEDESHSTENLSISPTH
jgi:hypothetical protein